jgi:cytoskeletal protein CcmA (bactofilin family)
LHEHNVTVGKEGRIKASVHAKGVTVEGAVQGDLYSQEQVIVRSSGNVHGNITAPRVSLEDGCKFKGAIDMDVKQQEKRADTSHNIADIKPAPALKSDEVRKPAQNEVRKPAQNKPGHQASVK